MSSWGAGWVLNIISGGTASGTLGDTGTPVAGNAYFYGGSAMGGTLYVNGNTYLNGANITGVTSLSSTQNLTVYGNAALTATNVYTGGTHTVNGSQTTTGTNRVGGNQIVTGTGANLSVGTLNEVLGTQSVSMNGVVNVTGENNVWQGVSVSGTASLTAGTNTVVSGGVTVSGSGSFTGTTNNITGNVTLSDNGSFTSGSGNGSITGNLIMTDSSHIYGVNNFTGFAHIGGSSNIHNNQTTGAELVVTDTVTIDPGITLTSTGSYVDLEGSTGNTNGRIEALGDLTLDSNQYTSVTNVRVQGDTTIDAGTDARINDKNKPTSNNSSFEGDLIIDAGQDVTMNTGNNGNDINVDGVLTVDAGGTVVINQGTGGDNTITVDGVAGITTGAAGGISINSSGGTSKDSASFGAAATFTANNGGSIAMNTGAGTGAKDIDFGGTAAITAGGAVDLNTSAGDDTATFVGNADIKANGGNFNLNTGAGTDLASFDANATLTSSGKLTVNSGTGDKTLIVDGEAAFTGIGGVDLNTGAGSNSATFGDDASFIAGNGAININTGTGTGSVSIVGDTTINASGNVAINTAGGNDTIHFQGAADIDGAAVTINKGATFDVPSTVTALSGDLVIDGATFVTGADLEATTTDAYISNSQLGQAGKIHAGQNVYLDDNKSTAGGANGLRVTANDSIYVTGTDWTTSRYAQDTHLEALNNIEVHDTEFTSDSHVITAANDVDLYGVNFGSTSIGTPSVISSSDGNITIGNSQNVPTQGSLIGSGAQITTDIGGTGGSITITGHDVTSASTTTLQDEVSVTAKGDLTLEDIRIGIDGDIKTLGGNVIIDDVWSGLGTVISSTGTPGTGENIWTLTGSNTEIMGKISLDSGGLDTVNVDDGYYRLIENVSGKMDLNFYGGQIKTIDNSGSDSGSTVILYSHNNVQEDPNTLPANKQGQSIENIYGHATERDELTVASNVRFTEFLNPAHNYDNPVPPNFLDPTPANRYPITNQITTITDYDLITLAAGTTGRTGLEIGTRDDTVGTNNVAKLQSKEVLVNSNADLFLHGYITNTGGTIHEVDDLTVRGNNSNLWLDRITVAGLNGGTTEIQVSGTGSRIVGYLDRNAITGDFLGNGYNIMGSLGVGTGATIQVYDVNYYDGLFMALRECTQDGSYKLPLFHEAKSQQGEGMSISGDLTMAGNSTLKVRIFTDYDVNHFADVKDYDKDDNFLGTYTNMAVNSSDFVSVDGTATFGGQAKLDVTFGNDNELTAKIGDRYGSSPAYEGFKLYTGDGSTHDNSYYYSVVRSGDDIAIGSYTGTAIDDNWVLGNNLNIVKSDMLGTWDTMISGDGQDVILRFRLLAKHPVDGGIAADMKEPNAAAAAAQIDRIRYPFDHDDIHVRYDGDMVKYYSQNGNLFPNYKYEYILDWENLLREIQKTIESGGTLHTAMRKLHPEPYADLATLNFGLVDQFQQTREQHGISALFQVEKDIRDNMQARIDGNTSAYASVNDDYCGDYYYNQFVDNPIRFWAAPFGSTGRQQRIGTEYGYNTDVWGGAFGVNKEWGDFYFGLSAGYARGDTTWSELDASAKTDAYMADAVIGYRRGMAFFEGFATYAWNEHSVSRYINIGNYTGTGRGDYHDNVWSGGFRMGYQQVFCDSFLFVPTIGVNYIQTESSAFTETGSNFQATLLDFAKGGIKRHNVRVPLMARVSKPFAICDYILTPELRGGAIAYFGDKRSKATTRFVGDPGPSSQGQFTAIGLETGRWAAQLGASIELSRKGRFTLTGNYDFVVAKKRQDHNYSLMMGLNF